MPYHTINFSDVDSFEPLPGGEWYGVEIDKVEVRENKDGDALYLNWELVVIDGDYENRRLWMITSLKDTALFRLKAVFDQLDVMDDDNEIEIEYDDDIDPSTKSGPRLLYPGVEGLEASVFVKNEMYDGVERNKVTEMRSEAPKKQRRKSRRDDEDEQPRSRSRTVTRSRRDEDEDYDDRPRRRSRRDEEEEDEEERPQRRQSRSRSPRRRIR
jgi:hypothetical protein